MTTAAKQIELFCTKGTAYQDFLHLAAQPLVFSSDLLYKLWFNFRVHTGKTPKEQTPYLVVSDLILSSLCQPIGVDLYKLEEEVRSFILGKIDSNVKKDIAFFVEEYAVHQKANLSQNIYEIYRIWAAGVLRPKEMEQTIIDKLESDIGDYEKVGYLSLYYNNLDTKNDGTEQANITLEIAKDVNDKNILKTYLSDALMRLVKGEPAPITPKILDAEEAVLIIKEARKLARENKLDEAAIKFQKVIEHYEELVRSESSQRPYTSDLANAHLDLANVLSKSPLKWKRAIANYNISIELLEELENPSIEEQYTLALAYHDFGMLYIKDKDYKSAEQNLIKAIKIVKELVISKSDYLQDLGVYLYRYGDTLFQLSKDKEAEKAYIDALEVTRKSVEYFSRNLTTHFNLYTVLVKIGDLEKDKNNNQIALKRYEEASKIINEILLSDEKHIHYDIALADVNEKIGLIHFDQDNYQLAEEYLIECHNIRQSLFEATPADIHLKEQLATTCYHLGEIYFAVKSLTLSERFYQKQSQLFEELLKVESDNLKYTYGLALSQEGLGTVFFAKRNFDKAFPHFEKNIKLLHQYFEFDERSEQANKRLGVAYALLGRSNYRLGNYDKAEEQLSSSIAYGYEGEDIKNILRDISEKEILEYSIEWQQEKEDEIKKPVKVFISYAHEDEVYKDELNKFLKPYEHQGIIRIWDDRDILAGQDWNYEINMAFYEADVVLFLISSSFMASGYVDGKEIELATKLHDEKSLILIPIIVRPADMSMLDLRRFQAVPTNAKPISIWENADEAWLDVTSQLERVFRKIYSGELKLNKNSISKNKTITEQKDNNQILEQIQNYLGQTKLRKAVDEMLNISSEKTPDLHNQIIMQSSRLSQLERREKNGLIDFPNASMTRTQITHALLSMLSDLRDLYPEPRISEVVNAKIDKALTNDYIRLDLSHLELTSVPKEVFKIKNLEELNLSNNSLSSLPPDIVLLHNLREINLRNNKFKEFPKELISLKHQLERLDLSGNRSNTSDWEGINLLTSREIDKYINEENLEELRKKLYNLKEYLSLSLLSSDPDRKIYRIINDNEILRIRLKSLCDMTLSEIETSVLIAAEKEDKVPYFFDDLTTNIVEYSSSEEASIKYKELKEEIKSTFFYGKNQIRDSSYIERLKNVKSKFDDLLLALSSSY